MTSQDFGRSSQDASHRFRQVCTFFVDNLLFGLDVAEVQEVVRFQDMTRVPLAPRAIKGLINLRGQIVTAVDMRMRLGLRPLEQGLRPLNVIVRTTDGPISLLVDEIGDVLELTDERFESVPQTLRGPVRALVLGVFKLETQLLLILNATQCMDFGSGPGLPTGHAA